MRTLFLLLFGILFAVLPSVAICDTAVYLPKGSVTPWDGYLMDQEKADKVRNNKIDLDTTNKVNEMLYQEIGVMKERLKNSDDHNKVLAERIVDLKDDNFFNKVAYFIGGAVVTAAISYGVVQTLK